MKRNTLLLLVPLALFGTFSVRLKLHLLDRPESTTTVSEDDKAPALTLQGLDGESFDLEAVVAENKVVMVNFWATWCGPCKIEMPQFEDFYERYGTRGLEILAITQEDRETVEEFLSTRSFSFPILLDPGGSVSDLYGVSALPTTFLVGTDGKIIRTRTGVDPFLERQLSPFFPDEGETPEELGVPSVPPDPADGADQGDDPGKDREGGKSG
jgi:cytochrome c biogenesis protein CcmG/thiol:disulfide interchange protein DsbE